MDRNIRKWKIGMDYTATYIKNTTFKCRKGMKLIIVVCCLTLCQCKEKEKHNDGDIEIEMRDNFNEELDENEVVPGCKNDIECWNGLACDGEEKCIDGRCFPGALPDCEDNNPCTFDTCSEENNGCMNEPLDSDSDGYFAKLAPDGTFCGWNDCDDNLASVNPSAVEICDGIDNNCDGLIDEGVQILRGPHQVSSDVAFVRNPMLVVGNSDYAAIWYDSRDGNWEIYFTRISMDGIKLSPDIRITNTPGGSYHPKIIFSGSEYGIVWDEYFNGSNKIFFAHLSTTGGKIGSDMQVSEGSGNAMNPSIAFSGSEYGVVWQEKRDSEFFQIYFTRLNLEGVRLGADIKITDTQSNAVSPSIIFSGNEYSIVWNDGRNSIDEIYFARISLDGTKIEDEVRITNNSGVSSFPSIAFSGSEYGVTWQDTLWGDEEIYFAKISLLGEKVGEDIRITDAIGKSIFPSIVFMVDEYGLVWQDNRDGNDEIYFKRVSSEGTSITDDIRLTNTGDESSNPSISYSIDGYGIIWREMTTGYSRLYFMKIITRCL